MPRVDGQAGTLQLVAGVTRPALTRMLISREAQLEFNVRRQRIAIVESARSATSVLQGACAAERLQE